MSGNEAERLTNHQADPRPLRMYECQSCTRQWPSRLAATDCQEQDAYEDEDRRNKRLFRIHRAID